MKLYKVFALAALAASPALSWATYCGGNEPTPACTVSWDFTDNNSALQGDPLTYQGTSTGGGSYSLVMHGFTIGRGTGSYGGVIGDGDSTYSTDGPGARYGIGVHAPGESDHWGTKIDNQKHGNETKYYRDAVLMDFGTCLVSFDEINLLKAYSNADTDFELWAYQGSSELVINNSVVPQIPDYDSWTASENDSDGWAKVISSYGGTSDRDVAISNAIESRYFVLIAGANRNHNNDAFRLAGLTVTCDPQHCEPTIPPPNTGVPAPGTLALLGIGAWMARRRLRKQQALVV